MIAQPFWINSHLAIVPRPRGGDWLDDEMKALREAGIDIVASMLESPEAIEVGLEDEAQAAGRAGIVFVRFAIPDRSVPAEVQQFAQFLCGLEQHISDGKSVGIHCRACIGRASVVAASILIRSGIPAEGAWNKVEHARGFPVPDTAEQREWVNRNIKP